MSDVHEDLDQRALRLALDTITNAIGTLFVGVVLLVAASTSRLARRVRRLGRSLAVQ